MESKERIIDLREYFLYVWDNIIIILLITALFSGGMIGYNLNKQKKGGSQSGGVTVGSVNDIMKINHDKFYNIDSTLFYTDAKQPYGSYNSSARLFVDFDYSIIEGYNNFDFNSITMKIQQDALLLLVSDNSLQNVIDSCNLDDYPDMQNIKPEELKYMINKNFLGTNILQIVVTDVDKDRAQKILDGIIQEFMNKSKDFETIDNVRIIDNEGITVDGGNTDLGAKQINVKSLLKYAIVGAMGGVIFALVILILLFIFKDSVRNEIDIRFAEMSLFGKASFKNKKRKEDIKRLAYNISILKNVKQLSVVPVDIKAEDDALVDAIKEEISKVNKEININSEKNICDNANVILNVVNSDGIVLLARYGKTRMKDLINTKHELDKIDTKIIGVIINGNKYV